MLNREESIFSYYFESMFYYIDGEDSEDGEDGEDNQYKLKNTFTFGIQFFQERRIDYNNNINDVSNFVVDKKEESAELKKENDVLEKYYEKLVTKELITNSSGIQIENINIDIKQSSVSTTNCSVMNNLECPSQIQNIANSNSNIIQKSTLATNHPVVNNNEYLSPSSNNPNELLNSSNGLSYNFNDNLNNGNNGYNGCNGYPSSSNSISDFIPNDDDQSTYTLPLQLSSPSPFQFNYNFDSSYAINRLPFLIYEQKSITNELKILEKEINNFINFY